MMSFSTRQLVAWVCLVSLPALPCGCSLSPLVCYLCVDALLTRSFECSTSLEKSHQEKAISWVGLMGTREQSVLALVLFYALTSLRKLIVPSLFPVRRMSRRVLHSLSHHIFSDVPHSYFSV